eukprot:CAMPEP_0172528586 /NCGR_PEP_ID=MMETSP1067-20121228/2940_1 /TAXON_ID=265564 ORGANISM="Thalassiosira punctigera, Strain Tpunct2005C2" /NCGR_SAMPLE_ID=MMETSP1067 /ASSEMBLY_ACC=CAM_ASM_000444 /LENGTH=287 /DNA_ID=CAMNT_0013312525 /DNA_START=181 /DNA_END=1044 /DNA_ORIENTATION=-
MAISHNVENSPAEASEVLRVGGYPFYKTQPTEEMNRVMRYISNFLKEQVSEIKDEILDIFPVGSGAIEGMPGPAQVEVLVVLGGRGDEGSNDDEVVTAAQISALGSSSLNLQYKGPSPHHPEGDVWFRNENFVGDPLESHETTGGVSAHWEDGVARPFGPGDVGSCNVHMVRIGHGVSKERDDRTREFVLDMIAYVDYLTVNKDAFQRYADVKIQGAEMAMKQALEAENDDEDTKNDSTEFLITYKRHKGAVARELIEEAKAWRIRGDWVVPTMSEETQRVLMLNEA